MMNVQMAWFCALMMCASVAHPEENLLVADVVPFIFPEGNGYQGVLYEIVHEVALRVGHSGAVRPMPIRRQAELGRRNAGTLTTLLYKPSRQFEYTWLFKLLDDRIVLVANADAKVDISSVKAARDLRIGVILGSASEAALQRLGFSHIETVASVENNARKLALGRIDAWAVAYGTMLYAQTHYRELPAWRTGAVLGEYSMYLGGPLGMDAKRAKHWRDAFESMRRDGSYARILRTYHYAVPVEGQSYLSPVDDAR